MRRRDVLRIGVAALAGGLGVRAGERLAEGSIMTARGPITPDQMGLTLPHEHVMVDFIGADQATPRRYQRDEVYRVALPKLEAIRRQGVGTLVECTPAYLGRDPVLLSRLSEATGLHLLTNTGYYAANRGKHLPAHVESESAALLAQRWCREWHEGIEGTGIRPGFIKVGFDPGPLTAAGKKLAEAAAITHLRSGLTIAAHCGDGMAAEEAIEIVEGKGARAEAFIWVHAQNEREMQRLTSLAKRGAWVELDGIGPNSMERHATLVVAMKEAGLLDRVLISQDAGWYHVGEEGGGSYRGHDLLVAEFLPALERKGLSAQEVARLTRVQPTEAFSIQVRAS